MTTDVLDVTPAELLDLLGRPTNGSDVTADEVSAFLAAGHDDATTRRVLDYLSRVGKKVKRAVLAGEPIPEVTVMAAHRGRITGFALVCSCGLVASKLAGSRRLADLAAVGHLRADHDSVGRIVSR